LWRGGGISRTKSGGLKARLVVKYARVGDTVSLWAGEHRRGYFTLLELYENGGTGSEEYGSENKMPCRNPGVWFLEKTRRKVASDMKRAALSFFY
jgi:hypothetical protein